MKLCLCLLLLLGFSMPGMAAPENPGNVLLRQDGREYLFAPCIKNEQWKILPARTDESGKCVYRPDGTAAPAVAVTAVTAEKEGKTDAVWRFEVLDGSGLRNVAVVLRLPVSAFSGAEIQLGAKNRFRIAAEPGGRNQFGRGNVALLKIGGKTLRILLGSTHTMELMDFRVDNPAHRACELRFFLSEQPGSLSSGARPELKMELQFFDGEVPPVAEKTEWKDGDISCKVVSPGKEWIPFRFDWRAAAADPVWGDFGIEAPAGKHGFLKAEGAVFKAGGRRIRLWGCCLSGGNAATPGKEDAPAVAEFLRSRGYNAVRLTHLDASWGNPLDDRSGEKPVLDPGKSDRFFFFLNELKRRGIYYVMDGIHDFDFPKHIFSDWDAKQRRGGGKFLIGFSKRLQEYHNDYLRNLLTAVNPYTGVSLADDPALAGIQLVNEAFLLQEEKMFRSWSDFPASAREEARAAWEEWSREAGISGADFEKADTPDRLRFFADMQRRNYRRMYRFLRDELKVKSPIATTSCYVGAGMVPLALDGDFTEGHAYYSHPASATVDGKPVRTILPRPGYYGGNYLTMVPFALSQRIGYQPYVVGEWNSGMPERFDLPLLMSAFANIQDIDGAFLFQMLQCRWEDSAKRGIDTFGTVEDPAILVNMIPAAIAWHRGYVPRAERELGVTIPAQTLYGKAPGKSGADDKFGKAVDAEGNAVGGADARYHYNAYSNGAYLFRTFALPEAEGAEPVPPGMLQLPFSASVAGSFPADFRRAQENRPFSQSGDTAKIDTPKYAAVWGALGGAERSVGPLKVQSPRGEEFSVSAVSLDGRTLAESERVLVAVASAACARQLELLERRDASGKELPRVIWKRASSDPVMRPVDAAFSFRGVVGKVFRVSVAGEKGEPVAGAECRDGILTWHTRPADGSGFYVLEK